MGETILEIVYLNGIKCIKKIVEDTNVYEIIKAYNLPNTHYIFKIEDNTIFYQYLEGITLQELINNGNVSDAFIRQFIIDMSNVLKIFAKYNIIHKDLKPDNIIYYNNNFYIIDFGASRVDTSKAQDTRLLGTIGYASPEHFGFSSTTIRSDIYSIGKIVELMDKQRHFTRFTSKATNFDPNQRFQNYDEVLKSINRNNLNVLKRIYNYFGIIELILILFLILLWLIGIIGRTYSDIIEYIIVYYILFWFIDVLDYISFIVKSIIRKKLDKKTLFIKFIISVVINFTTFIILFALA